MAPLRALALLLLAAQTAAVASENFKLLILHNNDMHSRFEETSALSGVCKELGRRTQGCYGGFARTAHLVREARKAAAEGRGPPVVFLNAGDTFTGTPWFGVHKWKIAADFLNLLHPDVASFGNHEFDLKVEGVVPFLNAISFPLVAANLDFADEPALAATNVTKSHVLEVAGHKIGVVGFLTRETILISAPGKTKFSDEVSAIRAESERLDKEGVKIIIALGHSGYEIDQEIAREVPLVDLVVGGHTNTFLWNGPQPDLEKVEGPYPTVVQQKSGKKVPVVQAYAYTKYMGHLTVTFDAAGDLIDYSGLPLLVNSTVPQEEDVLALLEVYRPEVAALDKEIVGKSRVLLDGSAKACRLKECNFGNLIADAFVAYHSSVYGGAFWTDAPIALINGGAIRGSVEPNATDRTITRGEMLGAMPFDDQIIGVTLNGTDLLDTLELGVRSNGETSFGELLQVSGVRYSYDRSKPKGKRIVDVKVRCGLCNVPRYEPLVAHHTYRVLTTGFLDAGGDGHSIIRDKGYNKVKEDLNDLDAVVWYMKKRSPIFPEEDGRVVVILKRDEDDGNNDGNARFSSVFVVLGLLLGLKFIS